MAEEGSTVTLSQLTEHTGRPARLTDAVHDRLRAAILSGELEPGRQLSVPELARDLDVSRGSVREAVLALVAEGLAEERPRRGVVVVTLGATEVRHIHEVREVLEGQAARLCAEAPAPRLLADLDGVLTELEQALDTADATTTYARTDERFHALLAEAAGNPVLRGLIERLHAQMQLALTRVANGPAHRRRGHAELRAVRDAVRDGDPDAAESAMRAHIRRTRTMIEIDS